MNKILLVFYCFIFHLATGFTQNSANSIIIPKTTSWFMIGEVHLDKVQEAKSAEDMAYVDRVLQAEHAYRTKLVDSFSVNHFIMESAVSLEYFFNKYVQTGNEMWIDLFNNNEYQQGKLRSIAQLNQQQHNLQVSCIDYNLKKYYVNAVQSLFCITFYEPFVKTFEEQAKLNNYKTTYDNSKLAQQLLDTSAYFPEPLKPFFQLIIDWYKYHPEAVAEEIYLAFQIMQNNESIQQMFENYYRGMYPYFARLIIAFAEGYNGETETGQGLFNREQCMFWQLQALQLLYPNNKFCLQMGALHVLPHDGFDVIRQKIEKELKQKPFCFYSIPVQKKDFFSSYFNTLSSANTELMPWQQFTIWEAGVVVK